MLFPDILVLNHITVDKLLGTPVKNSRYSQHLISPPLISQSTFFYQRILQFEIAQMPKTIFVRYFGIGSTIRHVKYRLEANKRNLRN